MLVAPEPAVVAKIAAFVLPLGFDTFAVAIALGMRNVKPLRPTITFTVFEGLMPLIGIAIGSAVGRWAERPAAYGGAALVAVVGLHTIREAFQHAPDDKPPTFSTPGGIALAGLGISADEIAIGFPLGTLHLPVIVVLTAIGLQTALVTSIGIIIGRSIAESLGRHAAKAATLIAGFAFVLLACYLAIEATER